MRGPPDSLPPDKRVEEEGGGGEPDPVPVVIEPVNDGEVDEAAVKAEDLIEDYGWMANEEEFNREVMEEIEQEDYLEECFEEMWQEEEEWVHFNADPAGTNGHVAEENSDVNGHTNGVHNGVNNLANDFESLAVAEPENNSASETSSSNEDPPTAE